MNNRVLELAKQAGLKAPSESCLSPFEKKFAELIIRECAAIVNDNNFAGSTLGDRLLFEHFGVE